MCCLFGSVVFLRIFATLGSNECHENDYSNFLQGKASLVRDREHVFAPSTRALPRIFCWVIEGPGDGPLVQLLVEQMAGCDDYLVFSNHSSNEKTVALYQDDMVLLKVDGYVNNTGMVAKAYEFLTFSTVYDNFDWIVKVDSDTFFRPGALAGILSAYDPNEAAAITSGFVVEGALEIISRGVFRRHGEKALFDDTFNVRPDSMYDDRWLHYAVVHMGGVVERLPTTECLSLVLNGYNSADKIVNDFPMPTAFTRHYWNGTWNPELLREDWGASPPSCVRRDVVAIHPVKNVTHYREFQYLIKNGDMR